jgi:hypothetical protein
MRLLYLLLLAASPVVAQTADVGREVFVSTGEHGEASFSDVASPGAERLTLPAIVSRDDAAADLDREIARILDVAYALESSRLAREQARAEARAAAQPPPPQLTIVEERYASFPYVYARDRHHRFPHRPGHPPGKPGHEAPPQPETPVEAPRSRPFIWRND